MDDSDLQTAKKAARKQALGLRAELSADEHKEFSQEACRQLLVLVTQLLIRSGSDTSPVISLFWPIRGEIDCLLAIKPLRDLGLNIALPVVTGKSDMEFRLWREGDALVDAGFGSKGPDTEASMVHPDFLVMPLSGYDDGKNRLGYGGGFYDRYLEKRREVGNADADISCIGLAFSCQKLDSVPTGRYDQCLDYMVSEKGFF